jgi:hypothetical protein
LQCFQNQNTKLILVGFEYKALNHESIKQVRDFRS